MLAVWQSVVAAVVGLKEVGARSPKGSFDRIVRLSKVFNGDGLEPGPSGVLILSASGSCTRPLAPPLQWWVRVVGSRQYWSFRVSLPQMYFPSLIVVYLVTFSIPVHHQSNALGLFVLIQCTISQPYAHMDRS